LTCECGHSNKDHEILNYASGLSIQRCKALGIERRPMEPGSKTTGRHYVCACRIDVTERSDDDILFSAHVAMGKEGEESYYRYFDI
jgi:hypothetical protein